MLPDVLAANPGLALLPRQIADEMICDSGVFVVLIVVSPGSRCVVRQSSAHRGGVNAGLGGYFALSFRSS